MFIGLDVKTGERVYIDEAIKSQAECVCPICKGELIIKNGPINVAHFAHKSKTDCDDWTSDMSQWHKDWQNLFPRNNQEVILELEMSNLEYESLAWTNGFSKFDRFDHEQYLKNTPKKVIKLKHRADVLACGYAVEFQHSHISSKEFNERNWFYNRCGFNVIWIFDVIEERETKKMRAGEEWHRYGEDGCKYTWDYAWKILTNFVPQNHRRQKINGQWKSPDITVFFQVAEEEPGDDESGIIEKLSWAISEDNNSASYRKFFTSYSPAVTKKELLECVMERRV